MSELAETMGKAVDAMIDCKPVCSILNLITNNR